jgi:glycosyltransferase involved in cell wall biosynthesis
MERAVVEMSVVVPTYNRSKVVMRCLESLQHQTLAEFELLLVDNSPDAELRARVGEFNVAARVPVHYVPEPRLGLHNARHAGARAASGDVLVFTDDDAVFDPAWLGAYARCFDAHRDMAAAGGPVLPEWECAPPAWLSTFMQADPTMFPVLSLLDLSREFRLTHDGIFFGVNMAIRRDALFEAGGFNPEIFGDRWLGDGETGLNRKLWARGRMIGYVPDAIVHHHVPPDRMTVAYLRKRQANDGACDMYARFHDTMPSVLGLARAATAIVVESARDWAAEPFFRGRTEPRALRIQMRAARAWSRLQYLARLIVSPQLRALVTQQDWLN